MKPKINIQSSHLEDRLAAQLDKRGIPYKRQARMRPPTKRPSHRYAKRGWKLDFLFAGRIIMEVQGGIWTPGGRSGHTHGSGYSADVEKRNAAAEMEYIWLEATPADVRRGRAVELIERMLQSKGLLEGRHDRI